MSEQTWAGELGKGVFKVNPVFVLVLGMCPTLAVSTSVIDALAMGVAASAVLLCSNTIISAARHLIPATIRIPCYIVVIAAFVTAVELLMKAYLPPDINQRLGIFIPLIVVNCIILGRAEAFANSNTVSRSIADALGIGLGFTGADPRRAESVDRVRPRERDDHGAGRVSCPGTASRFLYVYLAPDQGPVRVRQARGMKGLRD